MPNGGQFRIAGNGRIVKREEGNVPNGQNQYYAQAQMPPQPALHMPLQPPPRPPQPPQQMMYAPRQPNPMVRAPIFIPERASTPFPGGPQPLPQTYPDQSTMYVSPQQNNTVIHNIGPTNNSGTNQDGSYISPSLISNH